MFRKHTTPVLMPALLALLLGGCASAPEGSASPGDPLESFNRPVHTFNDKLDRGFLRPLARGYDRATPGPIDRAISNFFSNLDDIAVLFNSALQAKPRATAVTTSRLFVNTTIGLGGLLDVAKRMGAEKRDEDFGQTLGYWGVGSGPYLVLPLLGPSTVRDAPAMLVDAQLDPVNEIDDDEAWLAMEALRVVDRRAALLGTTEMLETAVVDSYTFTRGAYLRNRANRVYDGDPPPEALPGDADEDFDPFSNEDDDLFEDG